MIKLMLTDLDGTLTDAIFSVSNDLHVSVTKNFYTRDFKGIEMLVKSGVMVGIITGSQDTCIDNKLKAFPIDVDLIKDCHDKMATVKDRYVSGDGLSWDEIAFIGDDINDLQILKKVGLAACPNDADSGVMEYISHAEDTYVAPFAGGRGCVRWFTDFINYHNLKLKRR